MLNTHLKQFEPGYSRLIGLKLDKIPSPQSSGNTHKHLAQMNGLQMFVCITTIKRVFQSCEQVIRLLTPHRLNIPTLPSCFCRQTIRRLACNTFRPQNANTSCSHSHCLYKANVKKISRALSYATTWAEMNPLLGPHLPRKETGVVRSGDFLVV
jgi:hypothetical protein